MSRTTPLSVLSKATEEVALRLFDHCEFQEAVVAALDATGKWERKACVLRAPLVAWFVVLLSLERALSIGDLLRSLLSTLRGRLPELGLRSLTDQSIMHARARLGTEVVERVYLGLADKIVPQGALWGLRPWAVDGVKMTLPDTAKNENVFGRPKASRGRAAFPQMTGVMLVDTTSRRVRDVVWGDWKTSEREGCLKLLARLGPGDLVFMDRGFAAVWLFAASQEQGVHFVCRASGAWKPIKNKTLGPGDYLATISSKVQAPTSKGTADEAPRPPLEMQVRVIEYRISRQKRIRLMTSLLDPLAYPVAEIAEAYHVRWEVELAFDEIKTHLATVTHGTLHTTLRSKTPQGALQEAYGLLIAYNLIRELILDAGQRHNVPPLEISFARTLRLARQWLGWGLTGHRQSATQAIQQLLADIADGRIDRPRRPRRYERAIKVKMSNWKLKRPQHRQQRPHIEAGIRFRRTYTARRAA